VLEYGRPDAPTARAVLPLAERIFHFGTAIVLPVVCFLISIKQYPPGPEWKREKWSDYLGMIPTASVGWSFYPLLAFSMLAALETILQPLKAVARLHVRVGLFTGIVLAYQYSFIQIVSLSDAKNVAFDTLLGLALPGVFAVVMLLAHQLAGLIIWNRRWYRGKGKWILWGSIGGLIGLSMLVSRNAAGPFAVALFAIVFFAPGLTLTTFVALSTLVWRHGQSTDTPAWVVFAAWVGWIATFGAAWRRSYVEAVAAYQLLPPSNPRCYIATAASNGHHRLTGARLINGQWVSPQLALFKSAENSIAATSPRTHRAMRRVYDAIGPQIARRMKSELLADVAYVTLKPIEWTTVAIMAISSIRLRARKRYIPPEGRAAVSL